MLSTEMFLGSNPLRPLTLYLQNGPGKQGKISTLGDLLGVLDSGQHVDFSWFIHL